MLDNIQLELVNLPKHEYSDAIQSQLLTLLALGSLKCTTTIWNTALHKYLY